jgi:TolB-like protein/AraC-like DNA-binding protein
VRELSSLLSLSSSQTLRKVKSATGKSVNQYIRELRLEKAAKLIKKTDLSIAEISYKVGFGSASYFNKTFSSYYGISPGEYKTKSISLSELVAKKPKNKSREVSLKMKIFYPVIIMLVFVIGYLLINNSTSKNTSLENSIAVLPFKDFSPKDSQWFSDGVSDNILHSLAQMKDLSVISFTSSSTFRDSDKTIPEIAKELGVSYILEGSVTLVEGKIKIIAQLIDSNDEHIWSKEYNENFDDIITIQNNVAQEVMQQLKITLSTQETVILEKYPTDNMEAYNLHLKGRLIDDSRKKEDLWKNIKLNQQAIALDSTFAEAYAEVAHSYFQLTGYYAYDEIDPFDGRLKSHKYADSAIIADPNTYRAWNVKALLFDYEDLNKAKEYYEKTIALNPNDALVHIQYSGYYQLHPIPDIKNYLAELTVAKRLNPMSSLLAKHYFCALIYNNKIEEAKTYLKKMGFLLKDSHYLRYEALLLAYKNKDWTTTVSFWESQIEQNPTDSSNYIFLGDVYNGVLSDNLKALKNYKKAYQIDSTKAINAIYFVNSLIENNKYKVAKELLNSENFRFVLSHREQLSTLWYYYYFQKDSKKTREISSDSLLINQYFIQVQTYALLGDRKKVDSINKKHPWGTGGYQDWRARRAILHAVLKERDSMYYYLDTARFDGYTTFANSRPEFDPYRNEERYKAFLRDNYLPVPGE